MFDGLHYLCPVEKQMDVMETMTANRRRTREEILAWLQNGREIKARRQKEAEELFAKRQKRKKEAAESGL